MFHNCKTKSLLVLTTFHLYRVTISNLFTRFAHIFNNIAFENEMCLFLRNVPLLSQKLIYLGNLSVKIWTSKKRYLPCI